MSFFLHQELLERKDSLERAVQAYKNSNYDTSVKQAVENLFKGSHSLKESLLKKFKKNHHASEASLVEGAIQVALNNLLGMDFTIQFLFYLVMSANRSLRTIVKK